MCFFFLSTKPTPKPPSLRHPSSRSGQDPNTPRTPTTPTTPSSYNNHSTFGSTSATYSSKASTSSLHFLSSLTHSLSENPLIYDPSQIHSATFRHRPLRRSSSSSSWRSLIDSKEVFLIQRKLSRPLDLDDLRRILTLICKSHHVSLVKLHGASVSGNYIHLVYEYVAGASLFDCLNNPRNPSFTVLSNWLSRVQIAASIAHGLDYVHNCSGVRVGFVHNRIKSSSIIVTESPFGAKLCHFGTAQLCGEVAVNADEDHHREREKEKGSSSGAELLRRTGSMKFQGTRGYMSPEFKSSGVPTLKSDVFAFGVVVLELVSGEPPLRMSMDEATGEMRTVSLIASARELVGGGGDDSGGGDGWGRLRKWVDRRLRDSYPVEVADKLVKLALECVGEDPGTRPGMGRVAGLISKLFLESEKWAEAFRVRTEITVSMAPR